MLIFLILGILLLSAETLALVVNLRLFLDRSQDVLISY